MEFISPSRLANSDAGSDTEQERFQLTQFSLFLRETGSSVPEPRINIWDFNSNLNLQLTANLEKWLNSLCLSFPILRELRVK